MKDFVCEGRKKEKQKQYTRGGIQTHEPLRISSWG